MVRAEREAGLQKNSDAQIFHGKIEDEFLFVQAKAKEPMGDFGSWP